MKCVFLRAAEWLLFYLWPIQRSWCQNGGWRLHRRCHRSLFSLFYFSTKNSNILLGVWLLSPTWLDREEELEEKYPLSSGSSERRDGSVYLGKLIDWEERWWWGERKKSGGRGIERRVRMVAYRSCDCTYRNPRHAPLLLLHRYAKQGCCLWKQPRKTARARWAGQPGGGIVNNLVLSLIKSIPTFVIFGTSKWWQHFDNEHKPSALCVCVWGGVKY